MSDIEIQLEHSNIADVVLKRIRKYCSKKKKKKKTLKKKKKKKKKKNKNSQPQTKNTGSYKKKWV